MQFLIVAAKIAKKRSIAAVLSQKIEKHLLLSNLRGSDCNRRISAAARGGSDLYVVFSIGRIAEVGEICTALRAVHDVILPNVFKRYGIVRNLYVRPLAALNVIRRNTHVKVFTPQRCRGGRDGKHRSPRRFVLRARARFDHGNVFRGAFADVNIISRARSDSQIQSDGKFHRHAHRYDICREGKAALQAFRRHGIGIIRPTALRPHGITRLHIPAFQNEVVHARTVPEGHVVVFAALFYGCRGREAIRAPS